MVRYVLSVLVASDYTYLGEWKFEDSAIRKDEFSDNQLTEAMDAYSVTAAGLSLEGAIHGTAVKVLLQDTAMGQKVIAEHMYSGESVRFYYAAYHQTTPDIWYIDQILGDVTYYAAMRPAAGVTTIAIASTMEELKYQLGDDFHKYELLT